MCIWNIRVSDRRGKECIGILVFLERGKMIASEHQCSWQEWKGVQVGKDCIVKLVLLAGLGSSWNDLSYSIWILKLAESKRNVLRRGLRACHEYLERSAFEIRMVLVVGEKSEF